MAVDPIQYAINHAYPFVEEQQQALAEGRITEAEWFDAYKRHFEQHYLAADNPRAQSGHGGDEARYRYTRMMVLEAIHQDGTFLDVGCANGYLMESLHRWLAGSGADVLVRQAVKGAREMTKNTSPYRSTISSPCPTGFGRPPRLRGEI